MKTKRLASTNGLLISALLAGAMLACGSSDDKSTGNPHSGGGAGTAGASGGGGAGAAGTAGTGGFNPTWDAGPINADGGPIIPTNCDDAAKLVYVVTETDNAIYSFDPGKSLTQGAAAFVKIGVPPCPNADPTSNPVNSMTLDRSRIAWVNYKDGNIYKVNLNANPLDCQPTGFVSGQFGFSPNVSMSYSSDRPDTDLETLYISDNTGDDTNAAGTGKGLAKVDLATMQIQPEGTYTGPVNKGRCALTGTGEAKLYGFFTTSPSQYAEIGKTNSATPSSTQLPAIDASSGGYAFSFWGGSLWFFTAPNGNTHNSTGMSTISRYDLANAEITFPVPDVGFVIVAAGVSTCAPLIPPIN